MTWQLWIIVGVIAASCFGLGCIYARAVLIRRGAIPEEKANAILGVFFAVIALAIGVDTVHLQFQVNGFVHRQVDCNTRLIDNEVTISKQRQIVDDAAVAYDLAMREYLTESSTKPFIGVDNMAYLNVQDKLANLSAARLQMIGVYAQHPWPPSC